MLDSQRLAKACLLDPGLRQSAIKLGGGMMETAGSYMPAFLHEGQCAFGSRP